MKRLLSFFILFCGFIISTFAQQTHVTRNLILVTLDGLRWQEVFAGANKKLISDHKFVNDPEELNRVFWCDDFNERRKKLMPFMWSTISEKGQIYGNREYHNDVNVTNKYKFSYPGYNEILTGIKNDKTIFFNQRKDNPNITVLEYLNSLPAFHNKVAAFCSWDLFPYILNEKRSGIFINAGNEPVQHDHLSDQEKLLNLFEEQIPAHRNSIRLDALTYSYAMEYLKLYVPKILFISFGETDDIAHSGKYDGYLKAINHTDQFIKNLWNYIQSSDNYRNKTTLIITTDHGRGFLFRNSWERHGEECPGSGQIWFAMIGPDIVPKGEIKTAGHLYQNQLARTMAAFLNVDFNIYKNEGAIVN